jgi:hypothetical protein
MAILDAVPGVGSDLPWDRRLVKRQFRRRADGLIDRRTSRRLNALANSGSLSALGALLNPDGSAPQ